MEARELPVTERLVARLWDEQRPFALPLATADGEEIQVVYRGRRRWDRGPDFVGALIATPGGELHCGDVEVHVRASDWRAHGHHRDPHYNGVILQVVLWDDGDGPTTRADGRVVPLLTLAPRLLTPLESLLSAPPATGPLSRPCYRGSEDDLVTLLERCGLARFAARAAGFESDLSCLSPDQLLYQGIADALGYSQNRRPLRRLAELVPLDLLRTYRDGLMGSAKCEVRSAEEADSAPRAPHSALTAVEALLVGAAGLLPSQRGLPGHDDAYIRALEDRWAEEGAAWVSESMRAAEWEFFRVRPTNFPTRRAAALACLADRWPPEGLAETLVGLAQTVGAKALPRALEGLLLGEDREGFWANHCDFGLPLRRPVGLIGRQRAAEVVVNVFLPFLAARASRAGCAGLNRRVTEAFRIYPKRGDNELTRYVAAQITGLPRPRAARSACRQQGLLHLYRSYCETRRCGECPVAR